MLNIDDRILFEATADELFLMLHIAKHMNVVDSTAFPSLSTLCKATKWSKPFVIKIKENCIKKGFLSCEQRNLTSGGYASNIYTIETDCINVFINMKGKKASEVVNSIDKGVVNSIDKGSKQHLQGVVNSIDKGSKQHLQGVVNSVYPNKLVDLTISNLTTTTVEAEKKPDGIDDGGHHNTEKEYQPFGVKSLSEVLNKTPTKTKEAALSLKNKQTKVSAMGTVYNFNEMPNDEIAEILYNFNADKLRENLIRLGHLTNENFKQAVDVFLLQTTSTGEIQHTTDKDLAEHFKNWCIKVGKDGIESRIPKSKTLSEEMTRIINWEGYSKIMKAKLQLGEISKSDYDAKVTRWGDCFPTNSYKGSIADFEKWFEKNVKQSSC